MWLPSRTTTPPAVEPLTPDDVRDYLRIDGTDFDAQIEDWIVGARAQVERLTATRLITQTVQLQAGSFDDLGQLPIGPIASVSAVAYQDPTGQVQQLAGAAFEMFGAGLAVGLRPTAGVRWPTARAADGAIAITAVAGYGADGASIPGTVRIALLQLVRGLWADSPVDVSAWLVNDGMWL